MKKLLMLMIASIMLISATTVFATGTPKPKETKKELRIERRKERKAKRALKKAKVKIHHIKKTGK